MKKHFLIFPVLLSLFAMTAGCVRERLVDMSLPYVEICITDVTDTSSVEVKFMPSAGTSGYRYGIVPFGTLSDDYGVEMVQVEGKDTVTALFEDLVPGDAYTVYAVAYDADGNDGPISEYGVETRDNRYKAELQFVTENSAAIRVEYKPEFTNFRYYLGKASDRDAFLGGEVEDGVLTSIYGYYCVSYLDMEAGEHVFYLQGEDLYGHKTELMEIAVNTVESGAIPSGEVQLISEDLYRCEYKIIPNDKCGKMVAILGYPGQYDGLINGTGNWKGDIVAALSSWGNIPEVMYTFTAIGGEDLYVKYDDPQLAPDAEFEMYVLYCDKDMNPAGVKRYPLKKPGISGDAEKAVVTVEVSDITWGGATYTFTADENTFGFMYDTVEADWYDALKETAEWNEYYLHNYLLERGLYWAYYKDLENGKRTIVEIGGNPETRYYAAACPMNFNGPAGWSEAVLEEYTTTEYVYPY